MKKLGTARLADQYLNRLETSDKLRAIANRSNYTYKVKRLSEKIQNEHDFWSAKSPSPKLLDLKKDLNFILEQKSTLDTKKIDLLMYKYGLN